jgi:hypothetical protein
MQSFEAQLSPVEIELVDLDQLGRKEVSSFALDIPSLDAPDAEFEILETRPSQGRGVRREFPSLDGAGTLPRAYLERDTSTLSFTERWIDEIVPALSPLLISEQGAIIGTPYSIRPYQSDGMQALMAEEGILLADDLGTGKTVTAILSMAKLFQEARIKRALIVAPTGWIRHWATHLQNWVPSLSITVAQGEARERQLDWQNAAHVYVAGYRELAADIETGIISSDAKGFDLVILDGVGSISRYSLPIWELLSRLSSDRRWVLSSGLPAEREDWLSIFRFLTPNLARGLGSMSSEQLHRHFASHILRRSKSQLEGAIPRQSRQEIWLEMDDDQFRDYEEALAEERHRLAQLGKSVTRTHIFAAIERLKLVSDFPSQTLDGIKAQALVDLVEEVMSTGGKIVVFTQYPDENLSKLRTILEAYGVAEHSAASLQAERAQAISRFEKDPDTRILISDLEVRSFGETLPDISYVLHFDHSWNPAIRMRAEQRIFPYMGPGLPANIYEFWVAGTIEERIHAHLLARSLLPNDLAKDTRPTELEEVLPITDWTRNILEVESIERAPRRAVKPRPGTGLLPVTSDLRLQLTRLTPGQLRAAVQQLMNALGFPDTESLGEPKNKGGDMLAWRRDEQNKVDRVLVRYIRSEKNIGVKQGRKLLKELDRRLDSLAAYLVATTEFTSSCRKLADESEGRLALISGTELYRHLHIIGWSPD